MKITFSHLKRAALLALVPLASIVPGCNGGDDGGPIAPTPTATGTASATATATPQASGSAALTLSNNGSNFNTAGFSPTRFGGAIVNPASGAARLEIFAGDGASAAAGRTLEFTNGRASGPRYAAGQVLAVSIGGQTDNNIAVRLRDGATGRLFRGLLGTVTITAADERSVSLRLNNVAMVPDPQASGGASGRFFLSGTVRVAL
jgi:hypothetical protein